MKLRQRNFGAGTTSTRALSREVCEIHSIFRDHKGMIQERYTTECHLALPPQWTF